MKNKKITQSMEPMTVGELKQLLSHCKDDARIIAKVVSNGLTETTGWVSGKVVSSIFKTNTIEITADTRGID